MSKKMSYRNRYKTGGINFLFQFFQKNTILEEFLILITNMSIRTGCTKKKIDSTYFITAVTKTRTIIDIKYILK